MTERAPTEVLENYRRVFASTWADATPLDELRFVVLDTEATGADAARDRLISIGAVAVIDGEIVLSDTFEMLLKVSHNQASVTVHGITRDEALGGVDEPEALLAFL